MAYFCWMLKRDTERKHRKREYKSVHRLFKENRSPYSTKQSKEDKTLPNLTACGVPCYVNVDGNMYFIK